jgi:hypothetical protein
LLLVSMHEPPHEVPLKQAHDPPEQYWPLPQERPQPPQL